MSALPNDFSLFHRKRGNHHYAAEAQAFEASLLEPIQRSEVKEGYVEIPEKGGYDFKQLKPLQLEGIISYRGGYTQVAGNPSTKHAGTSTLATTVVEGLNILDVLTVDRVVGQIFTEHPEYGTGQVPSVSFLGTRFENLRIAGHKIEVEPFLDILGPKPVDDGSYFDDRGVLDRIERQYSNINACDDLPDWASADYRWDRAAALEENSLRCSLFNQVSFNGMPGFPRRSFGHVIDLPFFGKLFLGELKVTRTRGVGVSDEGIPKPDAYRFHLTMIRFKLGCPAEGSGSVASLDSNGTGGGDTH